MLKAPFPWFGGKRRAAPLIWPRFGDVPNYVEPFFGGGSVLLQRPHPGRTETVNDRDAYVSNFWRAIEADPDAVLAHADWPVSEADLHARHVWLLEQRDFRERMLTDPFFFDARIAGFWWYGISSWIGTGWCDYDDEQAAAIEDRQTDRQTEQGAGQLGSSRNSTPNAASVETNSASLRNDRRRDSFPTRQLPELVTARGVHARTHARSLPPTASTIRTPIARMEGSLTPWQRGYATCASSAAIGAAS